MSTTMTPEQMLAAAREAASAEAAAIQGVAEQIDESLVAVIEIITALKGKVLVTGGGTSSTIARRMAHLLSVSGTPSLFVHAMDALHGTMGAIEPDDLLIALSKGGESDEINQLCRMVGEKGTVVVGIGERPESTLARLSDVFVPLRTAEGADPGGILAMGSTLVAATWGDALARTLMRMRDWETGDSIGIHPAGYVGKIGASDAERR
ncbi:SIS domain-containing protein [Microbacterium sp. gxy059]|uniref:SIS domain-containing protein n=1 Tax=Microbacterium sp. gxy059 TaxID=2957199 RepID=UPI003D96B214